MGCGGLCNRRSVSYTCYFGFYCITMKQPEPSVVAYFCHPRNQEAETRRLQVQSQLGLPSETLPQPVMKQVRFRMNEQEWSNLRPSTGSTLGKAGKLVGDLQCEVRRRMMESWPVGEQIAQRADIHRAGTKPCSTAFLSTTSFQTHKDVWGTPDRRLPSQESEPKIRQLLSKKVGMFEDDDFSGGREEVKCRPGWLCCSWSSLLGLWRCSRAWVLNTDLLGNSPHSCCSSPLLVSTTDQRLDQLKLASDLTEHWFAIVCAFPQGHSLAFNLIFWYYILQDLFLNAANT